MYTQIKVAIKRNRNLFTHNFQLINDDPHLIFVDYNDQPCIFNWFSNSLALTNKILILLQIIFFSWFQDLEK